MRTIIPLTNDSKHHSKGFDFLSYIKKKHFIYRHIHTDQNWNKIHLQWKWYNHRHWWDTSTEALQLELAYWKVLLDKAMLLAAGEQADKECCNLAKMGVVSWVSPREVYSEDHSFYQPWLFAYAWAFCCCETVPRMLQHPSLHPKILLLCPGDID